MNIYQIVDYIKSNSKSFSLLFIIGAIHSFILTRLIYLPFPELFIYPYLTNKGLIPYKQIFDQHFPGLMFLPLNLNNLGMTDPGISRIWSIGIILIIHILLYFICRSIFKSSEKALLVNLIYLFLQPLLEGWVLWIDNFLPLFYLPAFYFTYRFINAAKKRQKDIFFVGLFLGIALLFKQIVLPLAAIVFLLLWINGKSFKTFFSFALGFLPIPFFLLIYFLVLGAINDFIFWTIIFNLTTFAREGRKGASLTEISRVVILFSPLILAQFIKNNKLRLVSFVYCLGSLASVNSRFDFVHFQPFLPFAVILLVAIFDTLKNQKMFRIFLIIYIAAFGVILTNFYKGHLGNKIFFFDQATYKIADKIKKETTKDQQIYLFGPIPHLYQITSTLPVGKIFVFQFPWFIKESQSRFLTALSSNPPKLIVRDLSVVIDGQAITDFAPNINKYISENYVVFDRIETVEFLHQK